jgi:hypothetical protein
MAEVYWIHLPEHTDMFSEGYIGVTSKTAKERFKSHINAANLNKKKHLKISYAIKKYGAENLIVQTLVICSDEYALDLELKLRPTKEIGWNLAPGGSKPPLRVGPMGPEFSARLSERNRGVLKSEETKRKISETLTGTTLPQEVKDKISASHKLKTLDQRNTNSLQAIKDANRRKRMSVTVVPRFWKSYPKAAVHYTTLMPVMDLVCDLYYSREEDISANEIIKHFNLSDGSLSFISKAMQKFRGGWNPSEDPFWILEFKNKEANDAPLTT